MPATRRARRIKIGMAGAAAAVAIAASGGAAMGWVMGGTTAAIKDYKRSATASTPSIGVTSAEASKSPTPVAGTPPPSTTPAADGWKPVNNTIQWATTIAPGQPLSGVSIRNGDADTNVIAHFTARSTNGGWMPVASMTVSPGSEAVINPPAGEYAVEMVAAPTSLPFDQVGSVPRSPAKTFSLLPRAPGAVPGVRFSISKGVIRRLPDPSDASRMPASERRPVRSSSTKTPREAVPAPIDEAQEHPQSAQPEPMISATTDATVAEDPSTAS